MSAVAGAEAVAGGRAQMELHLDDLQQLFNSMDPAPFVRRDLDPKASDYIVDWAEETPKGQPLAMLVQLNQSTPGDEALLGDAVRDYYKRRAVAKRRELSQLFKVGRISLLIGLACLGGAVIVGEALAPLFTKDSHGYVFKESLIIGGWVALWRPIEIFLYDWWPIRAKARLFDRLGAMHVALRVGATPARGVA